MRVSIVIGGIQKWIVDFMENLHQKMDDDYGYPYFRKPPVVHVVMISLIQYIETWMISYECVLDN